MMESLIILTAWAEGVAVSVLPGDMGSQVASACAYLVDAAT